MKTKYIKYVLLMSILSFFASCNDDFLDKVPVSNYSAENFYLTENDAQAGINGIYDAAQSAFRANFCYWGEGRADNVKTEQSGEGLVLTDNNLSPSSSSSADWTWLYRMISRANYAIDRIPGIFDENDAKGKRLVGEARALRALAYFYLVRVWGDVPLITEPYTSTAQNIYVPRTDKELVLDQIEEDLLFAADNCAESISSSKNKIYFIKGGVHGLLTQVYMWRKNYEEALKYSDLVLKNSQYSLVQNMEQWGQIFTDGNSSESIFEVAYNDVETNSLRVLYAIGSYAIFTPSVKFMSSYEPGDLRIDYVYDTTLDDPKAIWKYLGKDVSDESPDPSEQNIVLIRLADIMLLRAEALNKTGNTAEALDLLNTIRSRAGLEEFASEAETNDKYGDMEMAILHERSIELCFEGHRWFDLVRTGKAIETMEPLNGLSNEANLVWPIHENTINKNSNIEQNDFYQ